MAKDFWRIESVDSVANMFVVQNFDGLIDRLRAAGETFTITPDGAVAVLITVWGNQFSHHRARR